MQAVTYQGYKNVVVKEVSDPGIEQDDDMIVKVTSAAICGSDLHLVHKMIPSLSEDYIIGHEAIGIVEETGPRVNMVKKGDRVVIPFNIGCGECFYCNNHLESQCNNANPHGEIGAVFGYSRLAGGYAGSQAQYVRVPFANFTHFKVPEDCELEDEALLPIADNLTTGHWSVDNAGVKPGNTVIVLGCGPVGLYTQKFAWLKGAERVIAVDYLDYRLEHAAKTNNVETVDFQQVENVGSHLKEMTQGGADVVIDCVGMGGKIKPLEMVETALTLQGGALGAIITASQAVRKGGTIQITGLYGSRYNAFPLGDIVQRNVTVKTGQAPVIHSMPQMYELVAKGKVNSKDPITHVLPLAQAEHGYEVFDTRADGCIKVVLKPH